MKKNDPRWIPLILMLLFWLYVGLIQVFAQTGHKTQDSLYHLKDSLMYECVNSEDANICMDAFDVELEYFRWLRGRWVWFRRSQIGEKEILIPRDSNEVALPTDTLIKVKATNF